MQKYIISIGLFLAATFTLFPQISIDVKHAGYSVDFKEISLNDVQSDFQKTGNAGVHPRLFFSNEDINRIKSLIKNKDPFALQYYEKARKEADDILTQPLFEYSLDPAKLRVSPVHGVAVQVPSLVFMYLMTEDAKYAERCWQQLEIMADYPDWGADRHFLDAGIGAFIFAFVYDALYGYLTPQQRSVLETAAIKHVIEPGKTQIETRTGVWKWYLANNNWNGICNGGLIMAALAMYENNPHYFAETVKSAANGLPYYLAEFEPDGQSEEGLMYWSYGLMYTNLALEAMERNLGTAYGYADTQGLKKTGWFPMLMSGPVSSINIGDDPLRNSRGISFFWFAKHFNDAALAEQHYKLCMENENSNWQDIYYYHPEMIRNAKSKNIPLDNYLKGIELMSLRENWDSKDAFYVAMHGGANNANHGHLDAGSFYIQAHGQVFAYGNLGRDDYSFPGFFSKKTYPEYYDKVIAQAEPGRWHFYRLRTEGKNCVVINPTIRPEQNEQGSAKLIDQKSTEKYGSFTLDLQECYARDVHFYERTISLDRKQKVITVKDDLKCNEKNTNVCWFMHTKADIVISNDGKSAVLTINGKQLKAKLKSPSNARFKVLPASYLLEGQYPLTKNSSNIEFKKLAIELNKIDSATLEVEFM